MAETFDVIIVLGAAQASESDPGPVIRRRVLHAVQLFQSGAAPAVLMSGGPTQFAEPEADAMVRVAVEAGLPEAAIFTERTSTRTFDNIMGSRKIMAAEGWRRALIVTDSFHMKRALYTFHAFEVDAEGDAVAVGYSLRTGFMFFREFFARQLYARMIDAYQHGKIRP